MAENQRPLSDFISSVEQVDAPQVSPEDLGEKPKKEKSKAFPIIVGILLVLILVMGGYYVYKQYFAQEEGDENTEVEENNYEEYSMKNTGWALFSVPEYEFSAEISPYSMSKEVQGVDVEWYWFVQLENAENIPYMNTLYPNYIKSINISFSPNAEYLFNCDEGCDGGHHIIIDIYENKEENSLSEIKETYFNNRRQLVKTEGSYPFEIIEFEENQKWNREVVKYCANDPANESGVCFGDYYILVNSDFIYFVWYYQNTEPQESYQESQKVIDSFTFGE